MVEDSERGLAAATAAGLECLIVFSEWTKDGDFRKARKVLGSIAEVPNEILRFAGDRMGRCDPGEMRNPRKCSMTCIDFGTSMELSSKPTQDHKWQF